MVSCKRIPHLVLLFLNVDFGSFLPLQVSKIYVLDALKSSYSCSKFFKERLFYIKIHPN